MIKLIYDARTGIYTEIEVSAEETTQIEQSRIREEAIQEIASLKADLSNTDYKITKCIEYQLAELELPYDVQELHTTRQTLRDRINELESEMS